MWCGKLCCRFSCSVNSSAVWLWQMAHRRALMMLVLHMCVCVAYVEMPKQSIFRSNTRRRWGMHTTYTYNTVHTHARLAHTHTTTGCIYAWSWRRSVFFVFSTSHRWQQLNEFGKFDEHTNMSYVSVWCMLGAYDVSVRVCVVHVKTRSPNTLISPQYAFDRLRTVETSFTSHIWSAARIFK